MTNSEKVNLPEPLSQGPDARLARVERALAELEETSTETALAHRIAERMLILEGQVNYHARMARMTAVMLSIVLVVVLAVGGILIWHLASRVETLIAQRIQDASKLTRALSLLTAINEQIRSGGPASLTDAQISSMKSLVEQIIGSDNNGLLKNLQLQYGLLDELEGKKPDRE